MCFDTELYQTSNSCHDLNLFDRIHDDDLKYSIIETDYLSDLVVRDVNAVTHNRVYPRRTGRLRRVRNTIVRNARTLVHCMFALMLTGILAHHLIKTSLLDTFDPSDTAFEIIIYLILLMIWIVVYRNCCVAHEGYINKK